MKKNKLTPKRYATFWKKLPVLIRPSRAEIRFWEKAIKDALKTNKNLKALVLGVTPEIRDLLAKYRIKTICLDINPFMVKAMNLVIDRKKPNEKIVIGDWLKIPFEDNSFDLVLSDSAQDNIPLKAFDKFFRNVFRVLKPEGYWLFGASHFTSHRDGISIDKYIEIYRKNPVAFKDINKKFYWFVKVSCHKDFYNSVKKLVSWKKIDDKLKNYADNNKISKKELKDLLISVSDIGKILIVDNIAWITVKEFYRFFKKYHFEVIAKMQDKTFPASRFKHAFVLKKNGGNGVNSIFLKENGIIN